jgi:hypothetical protein
VIHTVANLPGWDSWLTKSNPNWSTIKSCICNYPMASYISQYPTGHGPLYIDSDFCFFFLTIIRIFNQKNFIWKTEKLHMKFWTLLGYFAHPTSRAQIRLPYHKPNASSTSHHIW